LSGTAYPAEIEINLVPTKVSRSERVAGK
jgi:hypothetical protein